MAAEDWKVPTSVEESAPLPAALTAEASEATAEADADFAAAVISWAGCLRAAHEMKTARHT